jgi:Uracil-DNA glycosylase
MDNLKNKKYINLVEKRKSFKFADLKNPSEIENGIYDKEHSIGPWSLWQGNLDAEILVIGQDWGDVNYYLDNKGIDADNNPTNRNLIELFKTLNIDIGTPSDPNKSAPVFFTNAILGIKYNGMSSKVKASWVKECTNEFLKPLIEIIEPKIIITLGTYAFKAVKDLYKLKEKPVLKDLINRDPIEVEDKKIFAFYHCGGLGLANRKLELQKEDWNRVNYYYI